MCNKTAIASLCEYISANNGIGDKEELAARVQRQFSLIKAGKVFYNDNFAIRFGWNGKNNNKVISNTVLALSRIKKYDSIPLILCIVTHEINHLMLMNTTFLKKVSHSSQALRIDNIRGSINCSDICSRYEKLENSPENFEELFSIHSEFSFQDNLERLVDSSNGITGRGRRIEITAEGKEKLYSSIRRAISFLNSEEYGFLKADLDSRVDAVRSEIAIAALKENVNVRGRIIEYLITDNGSDLKNHIIRALQDETPIPPFTTEDKLGDYSRSFDEYKTETDIKTKIMSLNSSPKAYNVDKLLEFLMSDNSVYMFYIVGIDENKRIEVRLCSAFDTTIIAATRIQFHWAGRNSRGVTQLDGRVLKEILLDDSFRSTIDESKAKKFIDRLISGSVEFELSTPQEELMVAEKV